MDRVVNFTGNNFSELEGQTTCISSETRSIQVDDAVKIEMVRTKRLTAKKNISNKVNLNPSVSIKCKGKADLAAILFK